MTKQELIKAIKASTRYKTHDIENLLFSITSTISKALENGDEVTIRGFGVFKTITRAKRKARNLRTGEEITIPPHKVPIFVPSPKFVEHISAMRIKGENNESVQRI